MSRMASICLPRLAIERWGRHAGPEAFASPTVLIVEAAHVALIHAATDAARAAGARAGGRLTDARALEPGLIAVAADPAGDQALLKRLARWASRWSPLVEIDGEDGLRLDVSGIAHLFGGERALVADMEARFAGLGLSARAAIAPTPAAAWALARYGEKRIVAEGKRHEASPVAAALAPLPVAALRLGPAAVLTLGRLGLKTIGDLAGVPRQGLARRFREADNPLDALDRALGRKPEPLNPFVHQPPPRALLRLKEPVTHPEAGPQALTLLVPSLVAELEARRLGARRLHLAGYRVDGSVAGAGVATAIPSREPKHLERLLADKAAALDPGFGFDGFALEASWTEPLGAAQESLVEEPGGERDLARLVDRLTVKLGPDKVRRPVPRESHLPERASRWGAAVSSPSLLAKGGVGGANEAPPPPRDEPGAVPLPGKGRGGTGKPERLLDRPEEIAVIYATPEGVPRRFVWRRAVHDILRVEGPERIAPEWWRSAATARLRDYYRVEDQSGRRYWIFREGLVGDGRGGLPAWYLHGLFG